MYHFLTALLQPFTLLYLLIAIGLVVVWCKRGETQRLLLLVILPFVALGVVSTPLIGYLAIGSLEWAYPPPNELPREPETIVVLSGYVRPPDDTIQVTPSACDYRARGFTWSASSFLPDPNAAAGAQLAAHEWLGIAWYWLRGRI